MSIRSSKQYRQLLKKLENPRVILWIGIIGVVFLLSASVAIFKATRSSIVQPIHVNKADVKLRTYVPHVENQLIVRFKEGDSPEDLKQQIADRTELQKSSLGRSRVAAADAFDRLSGQKSPEEKYQELQQLFTKSGVIHNKKLYASKTLPLKNYYLLTFKKGTDLVQSQTILNASSLFDFAQGNYKIELFSVPNDPYFNQQWGYTNIQAQKAWDSNTGSKNITIAVIDSGIQQSHPDMPSGIVQGPDYIDGGSSFNDTLGHGTHVSGIIGAHTNNGVGVAGMNWDAQLMAIRVCKAIHPQPPYYADSTCDATGILRGLEYASTHGARVINISLGTKGSSCISNPAYQDSINAALNNNVVMVAAAGNWDIDASQVTPASCTGIITVAATDQNDKRSLWPSGGGSDFGSRVDLGAPGSNIYSTYKNSQYAAEYGTSQASPFVAGAAALLLSANPDLTADQVKRCLVDNADPVQTDKPIGGKRLNIFRALVACGNVAADTDTPTFTITPSLTVSPTPVTQLKVFGSVFYDVNGNHVKDPGDGPVVNMDVSLVPVPDTGTLYGVYTNSSGDFQLTSTDNAIPPGLYQVKIGLSTVTGQPLVQSPVFTLSASSPVYRVDAGIPPSISTPPPPLRSPSPIRSGTPTPSLTPRPTSITPTKIPPTSTPTGVVLQLYNCVEKKQTKVVNGKPIQISWLDCKPL